MGNYTIGRVVEFVMLGESKNKCSAVKRTRSIAFDISYHVVADLKVKICLSLNGGGFDA